MQTTQREFHRAARGCPMMLVIDLGSWSRPVAKNFRDLATQLER